MRKAVLILLAAATFAAGTGCLRRTTAGQPLASCGPQAPTSSEMVNAPYPGKYELRREGGTPAELPLARVEVESGGELGFVRHSETGIRAKAGGTEMELPPGTYYWTVAPESEMTGPRLRWYLAKRTGRAVLIGTGVVVVTACVAFTAAFVAFAISFRSSNRGPW